MGRLGGNDISADALKRKASITGSSLWTEGRRNGGAPGTPARAPDMAANYEISIIEGELVLTKEEDP